MDYPLNNTFLLTFKTLVWRILQVRALHVFSCCGIFPNPSRQYSKRQTRGEEIEKCLDGSLEPTYYFSIFTHRDRRVYFTTKIGTIGGTLGLFVGMSIVSFYELAFLLIALAMGIMRLALMRYKPEINEIDENAKDKLERIQHNVDVSFNKHFYFK